MYSLTALNSTVVLRGSFCKNKQYKSNVRIVKSKNIRAKKNFTTQAKFSEDVMPTNDIKAVAEKLNGRLAMLGFLAGSGYELVSGMNYIDQVQDTWPYLGVLVGIITFATLRTRNLDVVEEAPFTTNLELLNGRMAMIGVLCKFIYDSHLLPI